MKIYIPYENKNDFACYSIYDKDTIRAYTTTPNYNTTTNYTDFYINSHYLNKTGQQTWNNYSTLPTCIDTDNISDNVFYRNDLNDILLCTFIILIVCFYFPYKIISRLFGRWLKI